MNDSYLIHLQNAFATQPPKIAFQKKIQNESKRKFIDEKKRK